MSPTTRGIVRSHRSWALTKVVLLTLVAGFASTAFGQDGEATGGGATPQPGGSGAPATSGSSSDEQASKALFNRAIAVARDAQSISYMMRTYAEGDSLAQTLPNLQSEVQMARAPGSGVIPGWRVRSTGSGLEPGSTERLEFDVAWLANTVEFVDHSQQKVFEKTSREARRDRPFNIASGAKFDDFSTARPFQRELASKKHTLEGRQDVFGIECDVVLVELPGGMKARWAFAVSDGLPRRVERIITGMMEGRAITELQEVRIEGEGARLTPDLVRITVPEGFTEERPAARPAPTTTPPPVTETVVPAVPEMKPSPQDRPEEPGTGAQPESGGAEVSMAPAAAPRPAPVGPSTPAIAPNFTLPAASGPDVSLESLRGGYVVLEFSGSWCLPCRDSRVELDQLSKELEGTAKVFTLTVRERSREAAAEEYRKSPFHFGLLFDADKVATEFAIHRFPAFVVVAPDGSVAKVDQNYAKGATVPGLGTFIRDRIAGIVRPVEPAAAPAPAPVVKPAADPNAAPKPQREQTGADE
jgi:thiol-disulfide isomerase/thioredoxin